MSRLQPGSTWRLYGQIAELITRHIDPGPHAPGSVLARAAMRLHPDHVGRASSRAL